MGTTALRAGASEGANRVAAQLGIAGARVGGRWVTDCERVIDAVEPSTGAAFASVPETPLPVVADAVRAARRAFDEGPRLSPAERSAAIHRLADLIEADADRFARIGTADCGAPISLSRELHFASPLRHLRWWAEVAARGPRGRWEESLPLHTDPVVSHSVLVKEPIGVVASILAYNAPLLIACFKIGPALAAGCTTVVMPSPAAALAAIELVHLAEQAGLPDGVVNLVIGEAEVGKALTEDPGLDMVSFTGSVAVGREVMRQASGQLTKPVLELGGKSANILLPGVDLAAAIPGSIMRFSRNSGQACGSTTRILVERERLPELLAGAGAFIDDLVVGDPWQEATDVGPLISTRHADGVRGYLERAEAAGARVTAPDLPPGLAPSFVAPTLVSGLTNEDEVCREELFAPVAAVLPYDEVDEAIAIANDSRYGLNGMVWGPPAEAIAVARRMSTGTVAVNGGGGDRPDVPWGGYRDSGVGTERGEDGFAEFFTTKHIQIAVR